MSQPDIVQQTIEAKHATQDTPYTGEPIYTKMDPILRQTAIDDTVEYELIENKVTGTYEKRIKNIKYPDLYRLAMFLLSYNKRTAYLPRDEADILLLKNELTYIEIYCKYYAQKDWNAIDILNRIMDEYYFSIKGYSQEGMGQVYDVKMAGSYKQIDITRGGEQRRGLLDRFRGGR